MAMYQKTETVSVSFHEEMSRYGHRSANNQQKTTENRQQSTDVSQQTTGNRTQPITNDQQIQLYFDLPDQNK